MTKSIVPLLFAQSLSFFVATTAMASDGSPIFDLDDYIHTHDNFRVEEDTFSIGGNRPTPNRTETEDAIVWHVMHETDGYDRPTVLNTPPPTMPFNIINQYERTNVEFENVHEITLHLSRHYTYEGNSYDFESYLYREGDQNILRVRFVTNTERAYYGEPKPTTKRSELRVPTEGRISEDGVFRLTLLIQPGISLERMISTKIESVEHSLGNNQILTLAAEKLIVTEEYSK